MKGNHHGEGALWTVTVGQEKSLFLWWIVFPCETVRVIVRPWQSKRLVAKMWPRMPSLSCWIDSGSSALPNGGNNEWLYCWRCWIVSSVAHNQKDSNRYRCSYTAMHEFTAVCLLERLSDPSRWSHGEWGHCVFLFKIFLCWNTIDLQCCICFRCTANWLSYIYIYIYI